MADLIQVAQDTAANWAAVVLDTGEPCYYTDTGELLMGDGTTPGAIQVLLNTGDAVSAIAAAATYNVAMPANRRNHSVALALLAGAGAFEYKVVLPITGRRDFDVCSFSVTLPASANPTVTFRTPNVGAAATLTLTGVASASRLITVTWQYKGGAWSILAISPRWLSVTSETALLAFTGMHPGDNVRCTYGGNGRALYRYIAAPGNESSWSSWELLGDILIIAATDVNVASSTTIALDAVLQWNLRTNADVWAFELTPYFELGGNAEPASFQLLLPAGATCRAAVYLDDPGTGALIGNLDNVQNPSSGIQMGVIDESSIIGLKLLSVESTYPSPLLIKGVIRANGCVPGAVGIGWAQTDANPSPPSTLLAGSSLRAWKL